MGAIAGRNPVVMLVDDEPMMTATLAAVLELETDYTVVTCDSGAEALEYLAADPVDVVISDFLMPGINGLELLAEVRRLDPEIPRLLLTGYADKDNAIRGINEVGLFQYLEKPLDNDQLLLAIRTALEHRGLHAALRIKIDELGSALRHNDEMIARDEALQKEMDWARTVQAKFLPEKIPTLADWQLNVVYTPAMAVGGDYYDFIPLTGGRTALVMIDSAGHGVQAALGTALLKFATSGLVNGDFDAAGILAHLNHVLYRGLPRDIPVAAGVVVLESGSGRLRLAGAGLPKPALVRADGSVEFQPAAGLLLGIVDEDLYPAGAETVLDLEPGQTLLLFSDGLTEAQDADDVFYGEGPLKVDVAEWAASGARVSALPALLAAKALAYGVPEFRDDLTVLGVSRAAEV
jgi:serine phosphatase RsbU (regulator of sigma subunit)